MDHSSRLGAIFRQIENLEAHEDESTTVLKGMLDRVIARCSEAKDELDKRDADKLASIEPSTAE